MKYSQIHGSPVSKPFYYKVSGEFLRQDSQSLYSFGKIQNVGEKELSEEKNLVFHWRKISYFAFIYILALVLLLISSFIYIYIIKIQRKSFPYKYKSVRTKVMIKSFRNWEPVNFFKIFHSNVTFVI